MRQIGNVENLGKLLCVLFPTPINVSPSTAVVTPIPLRESRLSDHHGYSNQLLFFKAYAVKKLPIRGKELTLRLVLAASMSLQIPIISPIFNLIIDLGLRNSYLGLVIPYITISLPLMTWILATFFKKIPFELEESAKLDGC